MFAVMSKTNDANERFWFLRFPTTAHKSEVGWEGFKEGGLGDVFRRLLFVGLLFSVFCGALEWSSAPCVSWRLEG